MAARYPRRSDSKPNLFSSFKHKDDIKTFMILVRRGENARKLRGVIEHVPAQEVTLWREDGLDVMHHVILANNVEAMEYLLSHGFFVRPHLPDVNPYGQLAALLGERTLLQVLLQYRPDDYYPVDIPIQLPESVIESIITSQKSKRDTKLKLTKLPENFSSSSLASNSSGSSSSNSSSRSLQQYQIESLDTFLENLKINSKKMTSPLEVSARCGHQDCVRVILNQCVLKLNADSEEMLNKDKSDVTLACLADSPHSLALLLHHGEPSQSEFEAAISVCLHHAHAECLDLLLQLGRETKTMFKGMNFFHVLYTYSSDHGKLSYARLTQTTEVLVKHGHDVNCRTPSRTYPMYSLLTHAFCFHEYVNTQYYIKALRILLKHGADPSFDEVRCEKRHPKMAAKRIAGRAAFSSALHCLMETVETYSQYLESPALAVRFVEDCAGVLMGARGDMNQVGHVGNPDQMSLQGSVLHQLAKSCVAIGVSPAMVRCVLRHGADPNLKVEGMFAINMYFDQLFHKMRSHKGQGVKDNKQTHMEDAMTMCRLCMFMTSSAIRECRDIFVKAHGKEISPQIVAYVTAVKEELDRRSHQVHSLRDLSAWAMWTACHFRFEKVHKLDVSSELKTYILPMAF
ncbi:uncharacterized protein LOC101846862 [Aplysia californica]|uniref:Uncharacterized protein LOC101846862 n=1 Tax=Aplysia californica TaxID=6500 RepID=A0ABM1AFB9_APLCA|nr:uncharacterized protein LOC101846862 [Aplysia californica]